jgi:hypothetical protein
MKEKNTIKQQIPYFLNKELLSGSTYSMLLLDLAQSITVIEAEDIVNKIPERFQSLTGNPISRYSEMEILEQIIKDTLETSDSRFGQLQYYARKRLLELHNNPKLHDTNQNSGLHQAGTNI